MHGRHSSTKLKPARKTETSATFRRVLVQLRQPSQCWILSSLLTRRISTRLCSSYTPATPCIVQSYPEQALQSISFRMLGSEEKGRRPQRRGQEKLTLSRSGLLLAEQLPWNAGASRKHLFRNHLTVQFGPPGFGLGK